MNGSAGSFDVAVVGSGAAATAAALAVRAAGRSAVLVERGVLGGTCVNTGCVPSKTLLAAAHARHGARTGAFPGAVTSAGDVDLAALVGQKDELVAALRQARYADVAAAHGIPVLHGAATFTGPDTLEVDGRRVAARAYVVATGAQPARPDLPGLDAHDWLTSETALNLAGLPASLVVVGGGPVGVEFAQLFAHLGTRVALVGRLSAAAEPELAAVLRAAFADDGIAVVEDRAARVERGPDGCPVVVTAGGRRLGGDRLLAATGRSPRTSGLGLDAAGVRTDEHGFVVVDAAQRTSNLRVFAAGDVTAAPQYVYVAAAAGRAAGGNAVAVPGGQLATVDYTGLPAVVFTRPQLASAGLTERAAAAAGLRVESRVLSLVDVPRAVADRDTRGVVKLVADAGTGRLLGVHAAAAGAGELMLAATLALRAGTTVDTLAGTWAPYLTMSESLRLAAGLFRSSGPRSCCA